MQSAEFKIAPVRWPAYAFLTAVFIVVLIPFTAVKFANHYIPPIISAITLAAPIIIFLLSFYILYTGNRLKFILNSDALTIKALYGKTILRQNLLTKEARLIDFKTEKVLKPFWRTNGIGLPGYSQGWYSSKNFKHKYLAFATTADSAVIIPTTLGYAILLTPADPVEFLNRLSSI